MRSNWRQTLFCVFFVVFILYLGYVYINVQIGECLEGEIH